MPRRLDDLPKKDAKYWTSVGADVQTHQIQYESCKHKFAYSAGNEVECKKCHIGFNLGSRGFLKDGHLYIDNKLVL